MTYKAAVITSSFLKPYLEPIIKNCKTNLKTDFFICDGISASTELFNSIKNDYDGFIVSGQLLKISLDDGVSLIEDIGNNEADYYKVLFELIRERPNIDFSKVLVDTLFLFDEKCMCSDLMSDEVQFEQIRENFKKGHTVEEILSSDSKLPAEIKKMYDLGKIEYVLCRRSNIIPFLEENSIPYKFIYPHKNYICAVLDKMESKLEAARFKDFLPCVITVHYPPDTSKENAEVLSESIKLFGKNNFCDFVVNQCDNGYRIFISTQTARRITDNFTSCSLSKYLTECIQYPLYIGYGTGVDTMQAIHNSDAACKNSAASGGSYWINEKSDITGPLTKSEIMHVRYKTDSAVEKAAAEAGLSTVTVQKVLCALEYMNKDEITSRELADKLGVTLANANRFLRCLLESGHAKIISSARSTARGRPSQIYKININKNK